MRILSSINTPTPEQLKVIGDRQPGFRLIRGAAGSGKTTTALLRLKEQTAVRLDRRRRYGHDAPVRILVLTFNRTLEGYITELARQSVKEDSALELEISTFGRWAKSLAGDANIIERDTVSTILRSYLLPVIESGRHEFFLDEIEYILGRFLPNNLTAYITATREGRGVSPRVDRRRREILLRDVIPAYTAAKTELDVIDWNDLAIKATTARTDILYDVVIVDEAQDFTANQVRAIISHLADQHNTTFVLDAVQRIYPRFFRWKEVGINARPEIIYTLKENYRNTAAVASFARPLVDGLPMEDDGTLPDFDACRRSGNKPTVVVGKYSAQLNYMLNELERTVNLDAESVALLQTRGGGWFNEARRILKSRGIPYCEIARRSKWPSGPELVAISTIHSAKGLEFDHVLLPGLNQEVTPHGTEEGDTKLDQFRRMLAMAIGRARKTVMIGYKPGEESSLIGFLDPSTYNLIEV